MSRNDTARSRALTAAALLNVVLGALVVTGLFTKETGNPFLTENPSKVPWYSHIWVEITRHVRTDSALWLLIGLWVIFDAAALFIWLRNRNRCAEARPDAAGPDMSGDREPRHPLPGSGSLAAALADPNLPAGD